MRTGARSVLMALALWLGAPVAASAQEGEDQRARLHFQSGSSYFDAGEYENALRDFETAYELSGRPALLYNIYLCHERLGDLDAATEFLERYLSEGEVGERRSVLEQRLANLRVRMGRQDDAATDTDAAPQAAAAGAPSAAQTGTPTPSDPAAPSTSGPSLGGPVLITFAAAGAALASAAVFGVLALTEDGSLEDSCSPTCTDDDVGALRTYGLVADVSLGVGLVAGAIGLTLWLTSGDGESERPVAVAPSLVPGGGGVTAGGWF